MDSNMPELFEVSLKSLTYRGLSEGVDITESVDHSKLLESFSMDDIPSISDSFRF